MSSHQRGKTKAKDGLQLQDYESAMLFQSQGVTRTKEDEGEGCKHFAEDVEF